MSTRAAPPRRNRPQTHVRSRARTGTCSVSERSAVPSTGSKLFCEGRVLARVRRAVVRANAIVLLRQGFPEQLSRRKRLQRRRRRKRHRRFRSSRRVFCVLRAPVLRSRGPVVLIPRSRDRGVAGLRCCARLFAPLSFSRNHRWVPPQLVCSHVVPWGSRSRHHLQHHGSPRSQKPSSGLASDGDCSPGLRQTPRSRGSILYPKLALWRARP